MKQEQVDVVVLGAGPAGYVCAIRLAQLGKKVTVIDQDEVGGVCLNRGCIPSKALIYAGTLYEKLSHASEIGIEVQGARVNFPKLMDWKGSVVKKLTGGVGMLLKANGCTLIKGTAKVTGVRTLEVDVAGEKTQLTFNQLVIATGSRPMSLKGFEVDQKKILDSTGALSLREVPKSMICIGGGYIGLELGTFYAKLGTEVTVVEAFPNLLGAVDPELTAVVKKRLQKLGVKVFTKTAVVSQQASGNGIKVVAEETDGEGKKVRHEFQADVALLTIGRVPNTENLGLETAGIKLDPKGFIPVSDRRETYIPGIYAIGDVAGQPLLAHKGSKEGMVAAEAIAGLKTAYDVKAIPAVIFTDPEIACVGLTEVEAKAKGYELKVGNFPFAANGRALSVCEPDGFVKVIGDAKTGRLLGVHIVGAEASNLIAEATLAIEMGAKVEDLALTVHAHPTLPETLMEASEAALGHAIHIFTRKPAQRVSNEAKV